MIEHILPHLQQFIEARVLPDGSSGRAVLNPLDWAAALPPESLPRFINQITGMTLAGQNNLYAVYNITVTCRLYYKPVGVDVPLKAQYDLYHYASDFIQAVINQPRLFVDDIAGVMPGIEKAVTVTATRIPDNIPYPPDDANGLRYTGATFALIIPIQVVRC